MEELALAFIENEGSSTAWEASYGRTRSRRSFRALADAWGGLRKLLKSSRGLVVGLDDLGRGLRRIEGRISEGERIREKERSGGATRRKGEEREEEKDNPTSRASSDLGMHESNLVSCRSDAHAASEAHACTGQVSTECRPTRTQDARWTLPCDL
eukprot:2911312-Rhodomonas_salina.1